MRKSSPREPDPDPNDRRPDEPEPSAEVEAEEPEPDEDLAEAEAEVEPEAEATPAARNALAVYQKEISRIPLLTREEELALAKRVAAGDAEAERRMVEANLRLVIKIARRY